MKNSNSYKDILLGLSVGDALGVPVEFLSRQDLKKYPVSTMKGYGSHNQPEGTWSDDSSLAFCLAESLCLGYDLEDLAKRFINWKEYSYWTPHGKVFDIGIATAEAIWRLYQGTPPLLAGGTDEQSNGNGSLMRILPLLFYIKDKPVQQRFTIVKEVSSLTHAHIRSVISCFLYLEVALELLKGNDKQKGFENAIATSSDFLYGNPIASEEELFRFHRIFAKPDNLYEIKPLLQYEEAEINSSGYVLHTLEASLWCFLSTDTYKDAVIKAVNLGSDTDTTGAVTGGLAGLYYGYDTIPAEWLEVLAKRPKIEELALRLEKKFNSFAK